MWNPQELTYQELAGEIPGKGIGCVESFQLYPSSSEAGAVLGEAAVLWAVADNLCTLMLSAIVDK